MRFVREEITPIGWNQLRTLGARDGWLVETVDVLRSGFGPAALSIDLSGGLDVHTDALAELQRHELIGVDGPAGTGIVAFATLPFDRTAPGQLSVPTYVITQMKDGRTWLTSPEGTTDFKDALTTLVAPSQETQSLRSLSYQPTPEEYAHNVALAV